MRLLRILSQHTSILQHYTTASLYIDTEIYTTEYVEVILKAKDQINEYLNQILNDYDIIENKSIYRLINKLKCKITSNEKSDQIQNDKQYHVTYRGYFFDSYDEI